MCWCPPVYRDGNTQNTHASIYLVSRWTAREDEGEGRDAGMVDVWTRKSLHKLVTLFGATLEQVKDGSQLISATEATTWI